MEKFGIFNLLSALSSLTSPQTEDSTNPRQDDPAPPASPSREQSAQNIPHPGVFSAEERKIRAAEMLERHDKIARRIRNR